MCSLDVGVLLIAVGSIEVDEVAILVGLVVLDEGLILLVGEVLVVGVGEQGKLLGLVIERLLGEHTVVDEELQVVPLLLVLLAVVLEDAAEAVGHLLGDV